MEYSWIFPHINLNVGIFCEIVSVPQNIVMNMNNVMGCKGKNNMSKLHLPYRGRSSMSCFSKMKSHMPQKRPMLDIFK